MSKESNNRGRAFEYVFLKTLFEQISLHRTAKIVLNSSYYASENAWNSVDEDVRSVLRISAVSAMEAVFDCEPMILEKGEDILELMIQSDTHGEDGDVRDILIIRSSENWEIGLSLKHNHFAVKHSRLAKGIDFGEKWFGMKCSEEYWKEVRPIFELLENEQKKQILWRQLEDKENDVYIPLLRAFKNEIKRSYLLDCNITSKMVEYLLGKYDFYKVIGVDIKQITQILSFNIRGTLNKKAKTKSPKIILPISYLPTRIVSLDFKPQSNNTVELYMDGGWQFSFRIHNASTVVEPSLKFDIQLVGMPATIIAINCKWR